MWILLLYHTDRLIKEEEQLMLMCLVKSLSDLSYITSFSYSLSSESKSYSVNIRFDSWIFIYKYSL